MPSRRVVRTPKSVYGRRPATPAQRWTLGSLQQLKSLPKLGIGLLLAFLSWQFFNIRMLQVHSTGSLDPGAITKIAENSFRSHPFSRNLLSLGWAPIADDLMNQENRIKSVRLHRLWPSKLRLEVTERQIGLIWRTGEQTYLVDIDGIAVRVGNQSLQGLPTVVDRANLPVKVGEKVVPPRFVAFCSAIVKAIAQNTSLRVTGLQVPESVGEVYALTDKGYIIKLDPTRDAAGEIADLVSVLSTLSSLKKTPAEYIDLRIEHKAYYR